MRAAVSKFKLPAANRKELNSVKSFCHCLRAGIGFFAGLLLTMPASAQPTEPPTLKKAYGDQFYIGAAINRPIASATAVRADFRRSHAQVEQDRALVIEQFNHIAPENDLKWGVIHPREGPDGYNWEPADAYVDFGVRHNMYIAGHTLVWHAQTPFWVFRAKNAPPEQTNEPDDRRGRRFGRLGFRGPRASREELLKRMRDHIHTVVGRYKGKIHAWDVVNEALSDSSEELLRNSLWLQIIGPDFIAKAFQYAHEADPKAILRYNDYGLENPKKRRKLIALIRSLQEQGVPVMAIGSQTHINVASPSFEEMDLALTEMESLGLPIHITELDVNTALRGQRRTGADIADNAAVTAGGRIQDAEQRQADQYANVFRAFLKHKDSVKVITFWGVNDAVSWRARGKPLLFDGNDQPKPAFDAVIRVATE